VDSSLAERDEIMELHNKGHIVVGMGAVTPPDLILSPVAWRMDSDLLKYLPITVKVARSIKYPNKKGEKDSE